MQVIPVATDANQIFRTSLNGQNVIVHLRWQDVSAAWFISLYNANNDAAYILNKRLCNHVVILGRNQLTGFTGGILAYSPANEFDNLGRNSFEENFTLYYLTSDELKQAGHG